jgi:hypothetical protein
MVNWRFTSASLNRNVVTISFVSEQGGHPMSVTLPLNEINQLTAGLLNALRAAEQQGPQLPPIRLHEKQEVWVHALPVDQWRVNTSPQLPELRLLHLLAAGGLARTFAFRESDARFAGEALAGVGTPPNATRN